MFWLEEWEQKAIQVSCQSHPDAGFRRLTHMMIDAGVVAVRPSSVHRVFKRANLLNRRPREASKKGKGFHSSAGPGLRPAASCIPHLHLRYGAIRRKPLPWRIGTIRR